MEARRLLHHDRRMEKWEYGYVYVLTLYPADPRSSAHPLVTAAALGDRPPHMLASATKMQAFNELGQEGWIIDNHPISTGPEQPWLAELLKDVPGSGPGVPHGARVYEGWVFFARRRVA